MNSHIHQCPKCGHTFTCDYSSCEGKVDVKDVRCLLGWSTGVDKLSTLQFGYVDTRYEYRRKSKAHKRALETLTQRPVSIPHREQDGPLWDVNLIG